MEEILHEIRVSSTTNLGAGVVRTAGGAVVFVPGAVEGDVIDAVITKMRGSYGEGRLLALREQSPYRITPDCGVFDAVGSGCGGCVFRHVTYEHELRVKVDYIRTAMKKCGLDITPEPFLTAGANAVRSKVTLPVGGYYARGTHTPVDCRRCRLHDEETDAIRAAVSDADVPDVSRVTVRRASEGTMVILRGEKTLTQSGARRAADALAALGYVNSIWLESGGTYSHVCGERAVYDTLAGCRFRISPDSFYQVNHACAELLYDRAIRAASVSDGEHLADLYCGTGTIGIAAAKSALPGKVRLTGVEINADAVSDAKENARANGVDARFVRADAAEYEFGDAPDCVILDPPRAGCGKKLIARLSELLPGRIVYVSCEPATLARDAAALARAGYAIASVTPVDMFPRTGKVECVCGLVRT